MSQPAILAVLETINKAGPDGLSETAIGRACYQFRKLKPADRQQILQAVVFYKRDQQQRHVFALLQVQQQWAPSYDVEHFLGIIVLLWMVSPLVFGLLPQHHYDPLQLPRNVLHAIHILLLKPLRPC